MRLDLRYVLTVTTPTIPMRVFRTVTTRQATLLTESLSAPALGFTGAIPLGSGIVATTAGHMWAAIGIMIAGPDADGTTTGMHTAVWATPTEATCITTPAMDSVVEKPSTAAVVFTEVGA